MNIEKFSDGILFNEIRYIKEDDFFKVRYKNSIISVETPIMKIPFGVKNNNSNHFLKINVEQKKNEKNKDFLTFIDMLESHAKENIHINFKEKQFRSRIYKNEYSTLVDVLLNNNTKIVNEKQERFPIDDYIDKSFSAIINFSYDRVWFNETHYGLSFKIDKMIIKSIKESEIKIIF